MSTPDERMKAALYRQLLPGEQVLAFAAVNELDSGYLAATTRRVIVHTKLHLEKCTSIPYRRIVAVSMGATTPGPFGSTLGVQHLILHLPQSEITLEIRDADKRRVIHDAILLGMLEESE